MSKQNEISIAEAAEILDEKYHTLLSRVKKGKEIKKSRKVGWGWILDRKEIEALKKDRAKKEK